MILVIDDQSVNRMIIGEILRREGYKVLEADCGPVGRQMTAAEKPDLILLDVMMPGESGFETAMYLKSQAETADIPIIFLSAVDDVRSKIAGLEAGAVDYITRPFHKEEVAARVRTHLRLAYTQSQLAAAQAVRLQQLEEAQSAILITPDELPEAKFAIARRCVQEAGGDFYDVIQMGENLHGYLVADVSGHCVDASFITPALKALVAQNVTAVYTPYETLKTINSVLHSILDGGRFITACYIEINRAKLQIEVTCAGHPLPLLVPANGDPVEVGAPGDPLGPFPTIVLSTRKASAHPGDRVFLFTDGLIEEGPQGARSRESGIAQLKVLLEQTRQMPLAQAVDHVIVQVAGDNANPADDILLMGVEI